MNKLIPLLAGIIFGLGLSISGMTDSQKVIGFLDLFGQWDASLLFVMATAVPTVLLGYTFVFKRKAPLFSDKFYLPTKSNFDKPLVVGAILFGLGWGLLGYCPGPAIASLAYLEPKIIVFVVAMLIGMFIATKINLEK